MWIGVGELFGVIELLVVVVERRKLIVLLDLLLEVLDVIRQLVDDLLVVLVGLVLLLEFLAPLREVLLREQTELVARVQRRAERDLVAAVLLLELLQNVADQFATQRVVRCGDLLHVQNARVRLLLVEYVEILQ